MTLMLLGLPAFAIPATNDAACVNASPATLPACECVFKSVASDWENPNDTLDPAGTCYEFTSIVNAVPATSRETALSRMTSVGNYMACYSAREFTSTVSFATGYPWVTGQILDSMQDPECGVGVGIGVLRDMWQEEDGDWTVVGGKGDVLLMVDWDPNFPRAQLLTVWELDDDGDKKADDMILYWDDGRIWIAYDYASIDRLNPPDSGDKDDDRK